MAEEQGVLAEAAAKVKLDIACGANCTEGFDGVDIAKVNDRVKHVHNLLSFPWPFADESVDEIVCSMTPEPFLGVGRWYEDFSQVTDEEVRILLEEATRQLLHG